MPIKKGTNPNHLPRGSIKKVEPIKRTEDIRAIKVLLADNPRNYCLFTLGINTNLRASDLCRITFNMVSGLKPMDAIELKEKKTGKTRRITLNKACIKAINDLLDSQGYKEGDYLFRGQRGTILPTCVHALVKRWCRAINLKGNYGSHTLRKTFGYQQRVKYDVGMPELMTCFNHSTQKQTLDYLCVQPEEIEKVYANEV